MSEFLSALLIFVSVSGAAFLAMWVRRNLPAHHLSSETKDVVKITMGTVATMTALMLSLLVSSARGKYEAEHQAIMEMAGKLGLLDGTLRAYGADAKPARAAIRNAVELTVNRYWPQTESQAAQLVVPERPSAEAVYFAVQQLSPQNDVQRALKEFALENLYDIGLARWMFAEQATSSISVPLLVFVGCWLAILFFSFGLFAPTNGTVSTAFVVAAICVSSAVFLILELDQPFGGLIKIPSRHLVDTLKLMGN